MNCLILYLGLPGGTQMVKHPSQCRRPGFECWVGKIPWRREWLATPVFLPGEFHRQEPGRLQSTELQGVERVWATNTFSFHFHWSFIFEGSYFTLLKTNNSFLSSVGYFQEIERKKKKNCCYIPEKVVNMCVQMAFSLHFYKNCEFWFWKTESLLDLEFRGKSHTINIYCTLFSSFSFQIEGFSLWNCNC